MSRKLTILFFKSYQSLLHIVGILIFIGFIKLFGLNELLTLNREVLTVKVIFLLINLVITNFSIKYTGLNKLIDEEYRKLISEEQKNK